MDGIEARFAAWRLAWQGAAPGIGLRPDAAAEDAGTALRLWTEIEEHARAWQAAADRVQQMDAALQLDDEKLTGLAGRLGGVALSSADAAARLRAAQGAAATQMRLQGEVAALAGEMQAHRETMGRAEARLAALRLAAGVADDAGLVAELARAAERGRLMDVVQTRMGELHQLAPGRSEAELADEAGAVDIDQVPGRLVEIKSRLSELDAVRVTQGGSLADCRAKLLAMAKGLDVAGPSQAVQDGLAVIEDDAARYVRLRLAHALLQGGIEQYRRSQQGPLLARAGVLFERLTDGRYVRLELDETERGDPVISALRPEGTRCLADHLSEGTRDQLFLALRLASIAIEAEATQPLPLIADDLLVNFDDKRARAALRLLGEFGRTTQVILFTHHAHLVEMADLDAASLHRLPRELEAA